MHEIGVVIQVVKTVENFAQKNNLTQIKALVLQIGALSPVIPRYVEECYPMAIKDSLLEETELRIEVLPANGLCTHCKKVFDVLENKGVCPFCNSEKPEMISGNEFMIKEIVAC